MIVENSNMYFKIDNDENIDNIKLNSNRLSIDKIINKQFFYTIDEETFTKLVKSYLITSELKKFKYNNIEHFPFLIYKSPNNHSILTLQNNLKQCNWQDISIDGLNAYIRQLQNIQIVNYEEKYLNEFINSKNFIDIKFALDQIELFTKQYQLEISEFWLSNDKKLFLTRLLNTNTFDYIYIIGINNENIDLINYFIKDDVNYKQLNKNIKNNNLKIKNYIKCTLLNNAAYMYSWKALNILSPIYDINDFKAILKTYNYTYKKSSKQIYQDLYSNHLNTYYIDNLLNVKYNNDILDKLNIDDKSLLCIKSTLNGEILLLTYKNKSFIEVYIVDNSNSLLDKDFIKNNKYYNI